MSRYHIGLDIGTSSVGFAVRDDNNQLVRAKGKNLIGARLFAEGQTAENRRQARTARRRYSRRKWRLHLLDEIFYDSIVKVDPEFFNRMKESALSPKDDKKQYLGSLLFPESGDSDFFTKNPTIYHLRNRLMHQDEKADIREIYLALRHIVKHRGNFLDETPVSSFESSNLHLKDLFPEINDLYENMDINFQLNVDEVDKIENILLDNSKRSAAKKDLLKDVIYVKATGLDDKNAQKLLNKIRKNISTEVINAILGYKINVLKLLDYEMDDGSKVSLNFSDANSDDTLQEIVDTVDDNRANVLDLLKKIYSRVRLNQIIPNGMGLSESMVSKYDQHRKQLRDLKDKIFDNLTFNQRYVLKIAYAAYIGNMDKQVFTGNQIKSLDDEAILENAKKPFKDAEKSVKQVISHKKSVITNDEFCAIVQQVLGNPYVLETLENMVANMDDNEISSADFKAQMTDAMDKNANNSFAVKVNDFVSDKKKNKESITKDELSDLMNLDNNRQLYSDDEVRDTIKNINDAIFNGNYMLKQRNNQNGNIPHQLHEQEMDQIIAKQSKYYPFLGELNPNSKRKSRAKYKLSELVAFRVPYYVGPLITADDQKATSGKQFAWMKRKSAGEITPWNFDEKVDRTDTAERFIKRLTVKDTYLINEDVLPDNSLLYQEFKVLNELNMVKVDNHRLSTTEKQQIFRDLFMKQKSISLKKLKNYLVNNCHHLESINITGLSDETKFNNSLSTYIDYKKIFGEKIDDDSLRDDFERMIEWSTVFEDRDIFNEKLQEISWLTDAERKAVVRKRYNGWGRLSKHLLKGLVDEDGQTIIQALWNDSVNFMEEVSRPEIKEQIDKNNNKFVKKVGMESILDEAYTSPQNKKAIRQTYRVVKDIQAAMGGQAPASISIEFTRSPEDSSEVSRTRYTTMERQYKSIAKAVSKKLNDELKDKKNDMNMDKYFLYFMQLGKDMYDGTTINIDNINEYQIDHIIPQSFYKDDSLDNRVLTHADNNQKKGPNTPLNGLNISDKQKAEWKHLLNLGLISKRKYQNLTFHDIDQLGKYTKRGFIRRQLVETSQVIKLVANILGEEFSQNDTKILEVKARLNSQMREVFDLYKIRELNDYHHAVDAYLTTFVGGYLYNRYPKLRSYFVYGDFKRFPEEADIKKLKTFNFLHDITNPSDENKNKIYDSQSGRLVLDRQAFIALLKKIYNYKYMLVTKELTTRDGQLFKQTIQSAKNVKDSFIPVKNDKDVNIYGGHSGNVNHHFVIAKYQKKNTDIYRIVGIPLRFVQQLKAAKNNGVATYKETLNNIVKSQLGSQVSSFRVILDNLMYGQLVVDGDQKYTLGSATYKCNAKQLVLSTKSVKTLADQRAWKNMSDDELNQAFVDVYKDILHVINRHFALYEANQFRNKLNDGIEKFEKLSLFGEGKKLGKYQVLIKVLDGLHASLPTSYDKISEIGLGSTPLGQIQIAKGIVLSENAVIYYQSPTGVFERKLKLKNL